MGYPMNYQRVINRNQMANGGYDPQDLPLSLIKGDLRRLETDQRDELHLKCYAEACNVTVEQAQSVLDRFFAGDVVQHAPNTIKEYYNIKD